MEVINNALLDDTAPKLAQVAPSVEYCQVPLPAFEVMAIPFDAPDEKPVSDVWVLLVPAPAARTHLELLASVAQLVLDSAFRAALLRCNDAEEIVRLIGRWDDPSPRAADSPP